MEIRQIIEKNRFRKPILEVLRLSVDHQPVTLKFLQSNIPITERSFFAILYLLESLELIKIQNVGLTKFYRPTELTELFLRESEVKTNE